MNRNRIVSIIVRPLSLYTFLCLLFFLTMQINYAIGEEGGACPKKKIQLVFWCKICKEIREFKDCDIDYIWDFQKHKTAAGGYADSKEHRDLPEAWGCLRISYSCINKDCEAYGKCIPHPGVCEVCMGAVARKKVWAKIDFVCTGCGEMFNHPGVGYTLDKHVVNLPTLKDPGKCNLCGSPLETVCRKSGTCPHIPSY